MTYEMFWQGNPYLCVAYREAHKLKIKSRNEEMWLQGRYIYDAVSIALYNAFRQKGSAKNYVEPYDILPKTKEEKEAYTQAQRQKIVEALSRFKTQWDKSKGGQ